MINPPRKIKINVLYILAFQILGFASALFFEAEPFQETKQEISIAQEESAPEIQDLALNLVCTPEGCQ